MSLTVAVKCAEGIVLATDSRRVLMLRGSDTYLTLDGEEKLWAFAAPHVHAAAVIYGFTDARCSLATGRLMFECELPPHRLSTQEFARRLGAFLGRQPQRMIATIGGVDEDGTARVFVVDTADGAEPVEHHAGTVGITYGGQREFVDRLLQGFDARLSDALDGATIPDEIRMQIALDRLNLHGAVELARFLVETTIQAQRFVAGLGGVGGAIDIATVTAADGLRWVQRKDASAATAPAFNEIGEAAPATIETPVDGVGVARYTVTAL